MKFFYLAIATSLFLYSCHSVNKKDIENEVSECFTEYYSAIPLRESPYPNFQGVVRLSKKEAMTRNHYRFTYDKSFRLVSVSFWLGEKLREPNHTANYFFTAPMQKIQYTDNKEIITYQDRFGNQIAQRGAYKSIYLLDKNGRRVALHYEDDKGNTVENSWGISNYEWNHQNDGSVIESRYDLKGKLQSLRPQFDFFIIRLYYEQNGIVALMQNVDENSTLIENSSGVAQDKLLFDKEGKWLGWKVLNAKNQLHRGNGPNVAKGINTSNKFGYESSIRYEDIDGSRIINAHGFWGSKRFYDNKGNYTYTQFIDSLGNAGVNEKSGYCYAIYTWDESGYNLLKIELQDTNRQAAIHKNGGYSSIVYEYNEFAQKTQISYLGKNGEPINRADNGVSYIKFDYNKNHTLKSSNCYNNTILNTKCRIEIF
ncbi:hypothetical protein [Maribellus maritimus]|uniref:hypothetical protein n=1 Tax=Maribellus maritimus TaxID=2870838 RepID=UPI001EEB0771|nr:hypothetical protein [Maribellus maritimus]MCG6191165.1 hypothetical protein [Maribellus maritimus]